MQTAMLLITLLKYHCQIIAFLHPLVQISSCGGLIVSYLASHENRLSNDEAHPYRIAHPYTANLAVSQENQHFACTKAVTATLISAFVFSKRIVQYLDLLYKSKISSLWPSSLTVLADFCGTCSDTTLLFFS